jgi:acyl-CoA synthetase (AMP-forming)/AMP-acid ligase II
MSLTQALHKALRERPNHTATIFANRRQSYAQLVGRVARLSGALRQLDIKPGDRVAMLSLNSDRFVEYLYGSFWAGAVVNPVNTRWSVNEIAYSLDDSESAVLLVDDAMKHMIDPLRKLSKSLRTVIYVGDESCPAGMLDYETLLAGAEAVPDAFAKDDALAAILYTGGTTGLPKGVMLSHRNLYIDALGAIAASQRSAESVGLLVAPLFHVGCIGLVLQLAARLATMVIVPGFAPAAVLAAIEHERVVEAFLVPTMIKMLIEHPEFPQSELSSLRTVLYGAAPIDSSLLDRAMDLLPKAEFVQVYGMTELAPVITVLPAWCHTREGQKAGKLKSAGRPIPIAEVRIVDENDEDVPVGTTGEIVARGPMVMLGYWKQPEQTANALRGGWMHTGDAGYMDADGFIYMNDRIKDMIVTGGENVYSIEVENAILKLPQVSMCGVIGVPDDTWGERVHAVIVLREGAMLDEQALVAHCKSLIAGYKCPRSIEFRTAMPLSAAGKLLKYELRKPYWPSRSTT